MLCCEWIRFEEDFSMTVMRTVYSYYRSAADYRLDNSKGFVVGLKTLTELVESIE